MYWIFFKIDFLLVLLFWIRKISSIKKPIIKVTPNHPQHRLIDWFIKYWSFSTENPQKSSAQNTCWEGENMIEMIKWKFCLFRRFSPQIFVPTSQWCSRPPKVTSEKGSGMGGEHIFITVRFHYGVVLYPLRWLMLCHWGRFPSPDWSPGMGHRLFLGIMKYCSSSRFFLTWWGEGRIGEGMD